MPCGLPCDVLNCLLRLSQITLFPSALHFQRRSSMQTSNRVSTNRKKNLKILVSTSALSF
jgi:hypothetical protein